LPNFSVWRTTGTAVEHRQPRQPRCRLVGVLVPVKLAVLTFSSSLGRADLDGARSNLPILTWLNEPMAPVSLFLLHDSWSIKCECLGPKFVYHSCRSASLTKQHVMMFVSFSVTPCETLLVHHDKKSRERGRVLIIRNLPHLQENRRNHPFFQNRMDCYTMYALSNYVKDPLLARCAP
jgi:hypothetical protein